MSDTFLVVTSTAVGVIITALIFWGGFRLTRTKLRRASSSQLIPTKDNGDINIPLVAAFAGWKAIPWLTWLHSDISPMLLLQKHHVTYKVVRKHRHAYHDIDYVDFRQALATTNIILVFKGKWSTFSGNTANINLAAQALEIFQQKGCQLSQRAHQLVDSVAVEPR